MSHPVCYCQNEAECCRGGVSLADVFAFDAVLLCVKGEGQKICCVQQLGRLYMHRFIIFVDLYI